MENDQLFAGEPEPMGGLTNENELARLCPKEFQSGNNPWTAYVSTLFFCGGKITNWKWKSSDDKEKAKQLGYFHCLLSGFGLAHEDKEAVAGWMLSEMLTEIPKHLAKTG